MGTQRQFIPSGYLHLIVKVTGIKLNTFVCFVHVCALPLQRKFCTNCRSGFPFFGRRWETCNQFCIHRTANIYLKPNWISFVLANDIECEYSNGNEIAKYKCKSFLHIFLSSASPSFDGKNLKMWKISIKKWWENFHKAIFCRSRAYLERC